MKRQRLADRSRRSSSRSLRDLPEEVIAQIVSYLDAPPRSFTHIRHEPTPALFNSPEHPLKNISLTCKTIRRIALPLLFRHVIFNAGHCMNHKLIGKNEVLDEGCPGRRDIDELLTFLQKRGLQKCVASLVVFRPWTGSQASCDPTDTWQRLTRHCLGVPLSREFWHSILSVIDCQRIILMGSCIDLARLAGCSDADAYFPTITEEHYQLLELDRNTPIKTDTSSRRDVDFGLATKATGTCKIAPDSLLHLRRWQHIGLNEGSFLHLYGTARWSERGPPAHILSILDYLFPRCCGQVTTTHGHRFLHTINAMSFMDSFSYTAIFPPMDHLLRLKATLGINPLQHVRKLDLQLAPVAAENSIVLDQARVGNADLAECWEHVQATYLKLRGLLFQKYEDVEWRLREVVCQDDANANFRADMQVRFNAFGDSWNPPVVVADEWKAWGKTWKIVDLADDFRVLTVGQ